MTVLEELFVLHGILLVKRGYYALYAISPVSSPISLISAVYWNESLWGKCLFLLIHHLNWIGGEDMLDHCGPPERNRLSEVGKWEAYEVVGGDPWSLVTVHIFRGCG